MAKIESSFKNMVLVLTTITCVSGALLGGVNQVTKAPIAEAKLKKQLSAIELVAPAYDNDPLAEQAVFTLEDGTTATVFPAKKSGKAVGAAVQAMTKNGFSGNISIMVGFDAEGNIKDYSVLQHAETPGLGSKMQEWFHNKGNVIGKNPSEASFKVNKDGGQVDAITAATISSRAFLDAVKNAYQAYINQSKAQ